ncbi:MAG TPA: PocR ligand-binding domain-containing protein [Bacillota bacterium]|nr:PocR ligand-binding domain-containing protein [Bacillota bacterium]
MQLTDLFTKEEWDKVLGVYKTVLGIAPITFDAMGTVINTPVFTCEACRLIKGTQEGARRCSASQGQMVAKTKVVKAAIVEECHAGFTKVVIPIFYGEEFLGVTGGCNIFRENQVPQEAFYLKLAKELGIDSRRLWEGVQGARFVTDKIIEQQIMTLQMKLSARLKKIEIQQRKVNSSFDPSVFPGLPK